MKTLEEIKEHLSEVGYTTKAMLQIESFLIAVEYFTRNEEYTFKRGEKGFEDFMAWLLDNESVDEEYEKGDYIHVQDGIDVLCLTEVIDGFFGGTNGEKIGQYQLKKESRLCNEDEQATIDAKLKNRGLIYCQECEELEPIEPLEENDISSECLDCMETQCHEAIENIIANLHAKEIQNEEKDALIKSLKSLIKVGKMYE